MTDSKDKKPRGAPDFGVPQGVSPASLPAALDSPRRKNRHSVAWPIVAADDESIAAGLAARASIRVLIHAGVDVAFNDSIMCPGTLSRRATADGGVEFELRTDGNLPEEFEAYALYAGRINLGPFEPLTLGQIPVHLLRPPQSSESNDLALSLGCSGQLDYSVRNASGELRWDDGRLTVRLDRPPMWRGQPVVVETRYVDDRGTLRSFRESISLTPYSDVPEGFALREIVTWIPRQFEERYEITVRPLRPNELDLLDSEALRTLLAGQELAAIPVGGGGRFTACSERQIACVNDPASTFLLRVVRKEVVA